MNAHNEQHNPACIAAYGQLFQADSRDPSQVERLGVWVASWNAASAAQPAAAQEAVATVESFTNGSYHRNYKLRWHKNVDAGAKLFAAPITAAPVPMLLFCPKCSAQHIDAPDERTEGWDNPPHRSHLCHACGCIWRPADVPTVGVRAIETAGKADTWNASTPAAPGIDLTPLRRAVELLRGVKRTLVDWANDDQKEAIEAIQSVIDASPKPVAAPGIDLRQFREPVTFWLERLVTQPCTEAHAARLREARRLLALIDASPKGVTQLGYTLADIHDAFSRGKAAASPKGAMNEQFGSAEGLDSTKVGSEACERIAAMLYEEATDEPWTVAGVEHEIPDRAYYRELARRVLDVAQAGDAEVQP